MGMIIFFLMLGAIAITMYSVSSNIKYYKSIIFEQENMLKTWEGVHMQQQFTIKTLNDDIITLNLKLKELEKRRETHKIRLSSQSQEVVPTRMGVSVCELV